MKIVIFLCVMLLATTAFALPVDQAAIDEVRLHRLMQQVAEIFYNKMHELRQLRLSYGNLENTSDNASVTGWLYYIDKDKQPHVINFEADAKGFLPKGTPPIMTDRLPEPKISTK